MNIIKKLWGKAQNRDIYLFELNHGGMRARVSNFGGVLQALYVKDADGREMDVVLGYDTLVEYQKNETFFGAMIGPLADRTGGGRFEIDGRTFQLPLNAGPDTMHSGPDGFHAQAWDWELLDDGICFFREMKPAETGFPGNLSVRLNYRIPAENVLRIEYAAECDCETAMSFTNHSYFNLDGAENHCHDQVLTIHASRYAETVRETDPICTGNAPQTEGTPFDFRTGKRLADVLGCTDFHEIQTGGGVDHYFLVDGEGMREHARIESRKSGLTLICRSDAPGVLVYTGNGLEAETGKDGRIYGKNWAICLETERFPNAVNLPDWRNQVVLPANNPYRSVTEFVFAAKKPVQ